MVFFEITAGSSGSKKYSSKESLALWVFEKKIVSRNRQLWVYEKNIQNRRIAGSGYFKNFKELSGFMKEPAKTWLFSSWLRTMVVYNYWLVDF